MNFYKKNKISIFFHRLKEAVFAKPSVYKLIALVAVFDLLINSFFPVQVVKGATLNPGSDFMACTLQVVQPFYTTDANPTVTVYWSFYSAVGNTQVSYRVQIDDDPAFGSINVDSNTTSDASARSYQTASLSFDVRYYWRLMITDNNGSVTDWISGDSFATNKPGIRLKGDIKLKGDIRLK